MPLKLGHRVTVVSLPNNHPLKKFEGRRGEVDGINGDLYLVDNQLVNGQRQGRCDMREWFHEENLELG